MGLSDRTMARMSRPSELRPRLYTLVMLGHSSPTDFISCTERERDRDRQRETEKQREREKER